MRKLSWRAALLGGVLALATLPGTPSATRCASAIAAARPVAYL